MDKVRVEQEEKRKTLAAETQQHQQVSNNNLTPAQYLNKKPLPPRHLKLLTNINKIPEIFNPKNQNISMRRCFLPTVLHTFPKVLTRRICVTIKSFSSL